MDVELQLAQVEQDIIARFEPDYSMSNFDVYSFVQIWPSIELGFAKVYDADSAATTIVFVAKDESVAYIYFGTQFAYKANPKNKFFKKDLEKQEMAYVIDAEKYNK